MMGYDDEFEERNAREDKLQRLLEAAKAAADYWTTYEGDNATRAFVRLCAAIEAVEKEQP